MSDGSEDVCGIDIEGSTVDVQVARHTVTKARGIFQGRSDGAADTGCCGASVEVVGLLYFGGQPCCGVINSSRSADLQGARDVAVFANGHALRGRARLRGASAVGEHR